MNTAKIYGLLAAISFVAAMPAIAEETNVSDENVALEVFLDDAGVSGDAIASTPFSRPRWHNPGRRDWGRPGWRNPGRQPQPRGIACFAGDRSGQTFKAHGYNNYQAQEMALRECYNRSYHARSCYAMGCR